MRHVDPPMTWGRKGQALIEREHADYALAYLRYLAGERKSIKPLARGQTPTRAEAALVRQRIDELVRRAAAGGEAR